MFISNSQLFTCSIQRDIFYFYYVLCIFGFNHLQLITRNKTASIFITDNIAFDGLISQKPSGGPPAHYANDGIQTTCSKTTGPSVTFHVDLKQKSIVTGLFFILGGMW